MFTLDAVDRCARALPEVTVGGTWDRRTWIVRDKGFVWDRPLTRADIERHGDARATPRMEVNARDTEEEREDARAPLIG